MREVSTPEAASPQVTEAHPDQLRWKRRGAQSPWRLATRALLRNRMAMVGLAIFLLWMLVVFAAPIIAPYDPLAQELEVRLFPPSIEHLCGTDELGRDVLSRVLYGARISIPTGLIVVVSQAIIGGLVGALAGYLGGVFDGLVMRLADVTLAFPAIVLAMAITVLLGPSLRNATIALILVRWSDWAWLMRGQVLTAKNNEYVLAARCLGCSHSRVLVRHIFPNVISPLLVKASLDIGAVILFIAALSFIGLGAVPPTPEWGSMISLGRSRFYDWWLMAFPGLAMLSVTLALNFLGDGIRDALDPRAIQR